MGEDIFGIQSLVYFYNWLYTLEVVIHVQLFIMDLKLNYVNIIFQFIINSAALSTNM